MVVVKTPGWLVETDQRLLIEDVPSLELGQTALMALDQNPSGDYLFGQPETLFPVDGQDIIDRPEETNPLVRSLTKLSLSQAEALLVAVP